MFRRATMVAAVIKGGCAREAHHPTVARLRRAAGPTVTAGALAVGFPLDIVIRTEFAEELEAPGITPGSPIDERMPL
jgi:hypothetical protein